MWSRPTYWRRYGHIPVMIILQIIFIILFGKFVVYNPESAGYTPDTETGTEAATGTMTTYPLFQDVHVMIFIGFGFLMTFLKKYGLSAVSLNMLCAVLSLQWATLVIGFFHMHSEYKVEMTNGTEFVKEYPHGVIYLDLINSMLLSDFASAAVLISFGVVIGKTTPLQLIVMVMIEIVLFVVNEIIGRQIFGAIDAGDSIFVHLFGAYFGLAASRVLYNKHTSNHEKQESGYNSDLFSMVGTIFLWMFWPSFNGAAAHSGEGQHRAILNTYFSLCASVVTSFAMSSLLNEHNKFVMEHIQNATLAGGVAIGAVADLFVQPFGALIIGSIAGAVSTIGFQYFSPWLDRKLKIHDTCGVNNLHGIPGIMGTVLSIIMAAAVNKDEYNGEKNLAKVYPALVDHEDDYGNMVTAITPGQQALNQLYAGLVTMAFALIGGAITGFIMKMIGKFQAIDQGRKPGSTVVKLVLNVGNEMTGITGIHHALPKDAYFDDNMFFEVPIEEKELVAQHHDMTIDTYDSNLQSKRMSFSDIKPHA